MRILSIVVIAATLATVPVARTQEIERFNEQLLSVLTYRNLGPFRMGARTSDIAAPTTTDPAHKHTFYLATWTGGLWKTTNNGTTFESIFDNQSSRPTIGDVAVAPSDPAVVWVGTGDAFTSRSSYAGEGVFKSTDAGKTWTNTGLRDSHHIARIVIHPTNPDVVYVASMGHLHTDNEERGVFRTMNGGTTWDRVLYLGPKIGVIDLVLNPRDPSVLYAATYDKQRLPWQYVNGGPGSGIHRTADGGRTWTRLVTGLPTGRIGRIGLDIYPKNPDIVYAVIENANPRPGAPAGAGGASIPMIGGEVYRTDNAGTSWTKMNSEKDNVSDKGPYYFSQIRVDPNDDQKIFVTGVSLGNSTDGGRTWADITWPPRRMFGGIFGDVRTLWIDPADSNRMILGSDGGFYISYDGGRTSDHLYHIPLGENYAVAADMEEPYNIYVGMQDHENWKGPSNGPTGEITMLDWVALGDGDGMFTQPDPTDSRWLYTTRQYGGHQRVDQKLGYRQSIMPRRPQGQPPYRFLWATPLHISPHDSAVIYAGAQVLLRSTDRGDTWTEISPDLSTNPADRILPSGEGGVPGGIPWFAITSISESPRTAGVIWAGTSDGKVHVTQNTGKTWTDVTARLAGLGARPDGYVSRVRASSHVPGRAYVSKSGYKFDDFRPMLYRTDDFGATWRSIAGNLPDEPINVVFEDGRNRDLLFVGNDTGVFVTIDGGVRWLKMNNNMPNVPVHDLIVHPRDHDLILASYGRGIWVTNVAPLQEMSEAVLAKDVHLFATDPGVQRITWSFGSNDYLFGQKHIVTRNEPAGMAIRYYLKSASATRPAITVTNAVGQQVARLQGTANAGINTVMWSMRAGGGRGRGAGGGGAAPGGANPLDQWMPLGDYTVTLEVGTTKLTQPARIVRTQGWSLGAVPQIVR